MTDVSKLRPQATGEAQQEILPSPKEKKPETAPTVPGPTETKAPSLVARPELLTEFPGIKPDSIRGQSRVAEIAPDLSMLYRSLSGCTECPSASKHPGKGCTSCPSTVSIQPMLSVNQEGVDTSNSRPSASVDGTGTEAKPLSGMWMHPVDLAESGLETKSLCFWVLNLCVGCAHGCIFCYVPDASTNKQAGPLKTVGVNHPEMEWGNYVFVRPLDEEKLIRQLDHAQRISTETLPPRSNGAILFCSTTDPYQFVRNEDPETQRQLNQTLRANRRRALELILTRTTLNVRILTRSPLVREDFDIFKKFGNRLLFGMSVPSLNDCLVKVYEPKAPGVRKRIETLQMAKREGLNVYVAVAPTYPECDEADLRNTLRAVKDLDPVTIFMESINIRARNVARIEDAAARSGVQLRTEVYATKELWEAYALKQMLLFERIAEEEGLGDRIHIWPDKTLASEASLKRSPDHPGKEWVVSHMERVSDWPGKRGDQEEAQSPVPVEEARPISAPLSSRKPRLTVRDPAEILAMKFDPDDDYLLDRLFSRGQLMTVVGPGGVGKSRLILQLIVSLIVGREFLGIPLKPRNLRFLVIQTENSNSRLQNDLRPIKAALTDEEFDRVQDQLKIHTLECTHDQFLSLADPESQKLISEAIQAVMPDVVVFDPLSAFARGSLNNDSTMRRTCQDIVEVSRHGRPDCSTIIVHHALTGKAGAMGAFSWDRASYGKGSKELHSQTRGQLNVSPATGEADGRIVISCGKNSNGREFPTFGARLNPESMLYELDPEFEAQEVTEPGARVAAKLAPATVQEMVSETPLKKKHVTELVMERFHCSQSTAYDVISKAEALGLIRKNSEKCYEKVT